MNPVRNNRLFSLNAKSNIYRFDFTHNGEIRKYSPFHLILLLSWRNSVNGVEFFKKMRLIVILGSKNSLRFTLRLVANKCNLADSEAETSSSS